jgi:uncharacterized protein YlzI (FlbEa/FlbD family)
MGYATVRHVPSALNYAQAKKIHDQIKPIRGKDIKPLGQRRDYDQYSVKMNGEDVQFVCYRTPVVTYHPDDTITISNGGWASVSTHQFIDQVLGIRANGYRGMTALTINGKKYLIDGNSQSLKMKWEGFSGNWSILSGIKTQFSYRLKRKEANNVRARYKAFADYFKGYIKLRSETIKRRWGDDYTGICISAQEIAAAFGMSDLHPDQAVWLGTNEILQKGSKKYERAAEEMLALITSDDHEKWSKAALWFFGHDHTVHVAIVDGKAKQFDAVYYMTRRADLGFKKFDEFILKWHAEEVLERVQIAEGKLPNKAYAGWLEE